MSKKVGMALERLAAFMIDWCLIAVYGGLLFLFVSPLVRPLFTISPFISELMGFCLITLPMVLYFSLAEASSWQATVGKRILRLRVAKGGGERMRYRWSFLRTAIKFLPWELAHFAVWNVFVFTNSSATGAGMAALILSYVLVIIYVVSLFLRRGRTPYDIAAGTLVMASN